MSRLLQFITALLLLLLPLTAQAHPHVWVDYWVEALADQEGITQLRFTWRFDTMFSQMVRDDMKIKTLTPEAIEKIRTKAFGNLKNYHYYTYIKYDGLSFLPEETQNFTAQMHGEQLEYVFTITLPKPAQQVETTLYDEEFYVDIGPPIQENSAGGSLMSKVEPKAQNYVSARGLNGAVAPTCVQREGETKNSPVFGAFKTFVAFCTSNKVTP